MTAIYPRQYVYQAGAKALKNKIIKRQEKHEATI